MESTSLASSADAEIVLKLYELRRDATMRIARQWMTVDFQPHSAEQIIAVFNSFGSQHNQYLRQVHSYWEMAASFVLRGALDSDLFVENNGENIFLLAKFHPFLEQVRAVVPDFFVRTEQLTQKHSGARAHFERLLKALEERRTPAEVAD
jgi:hypothetical protein